MSKDDIKCQLLAARDEYIKLIKAELLGPGSEFDMPDSEQELISSSPLSRYSLGILYPQENQVNQDNEETIPLNETDIEADDSSDDESYAEEDVLNSRNSRCFEFDETADENLDEEIGLSMQHLPSSMGITFLVNGNTETVQGNLSFATYRNAQISDCMIPFEPGNPDTYEIPEELSHKMAFDRPSRAIKLLSAITKKELKYIFEKDTLPENEITIKKIAYRFVDFCRNGYVREPHCKPFKLDFTQDDYIDNNKRIDGTTAKITARRTRITDNVWSLTIMLVNDSNENAARAKYCLFQPKITISSLNNEFIFVESDPNIDTSDLDDEELSLNLLYRNKKIYGTGLGVSVDWDIDSFGKGEIRSEIFPEIEVPPIDFDLLENDIVTKERLSMKYLSDLGMTDKSEKLSALTGVVDLYKAWIDDLVKTAGKLDTKYTSAAAKNIGECLAACNRMYAGIETLKTDNLVYSAFSLANRAMFMQRTHLRLQQDMSDKERYPDDELISERLSAMDYRNEADGDAIWRPFQIAFLLMDINSIAYDSCEDRDIVDLIWFPTGGGKTEAYLGLTAFTIFYRKLRNLPDSSGTTVIMRYTLRLLAAQQFTRAATLICACEYIRQDCKKNRPLYPSYDLGADPISIGLWIGGSHIPNKNSNNNVSSPGALECLTELQKATPGSLRYIKDRYNKFQVLKCPWCGTKLVREIKDGKIIGLWGYSIRDGKHFYMHCTHESCDFNRLLPIQIIDEELYEHPPTLLFGTVDKFAMLPWDGRVGAFFSVGSDCRAPELIIQDELHLISGSLGTVVGLYETAIDALCGAKGIRPKIISSTATIRRAKEQCSVLYNRSVVQFPSPGLNAEDSFFARESELSHENCVFGRKYIGIMPSGKTKAMLEIRAMAALLQKIYTMDMPDEFKDKLWTLAVYFNSLRDLGKASTLVDDDVKDFIIRTANRMLKSRRPIIEADELTSRVTTTELNETLDKLEKLEYSAENISEKRYASSVLLATNMISVGIDVARLNVMLIVGQPKLTSEYIQASSRIGRFYPGVVFVQYDATKSRDRSHYERFKAYHESFYRFVEPTGATPFSRPARSRALHSVITAMLRNFIGLGKDENALMFDKGCFSDEIALVKEFIIRRIIEINERAGYPLNNDLAEIEAEIDTFIDYWHNSAAETSVNNLPFYFGRRFMVKPPVTGQKRLLKQFNSGGHDTAKETLTSMRNVDITVRGSVIIWED